ncbi:hypothetical protein [[Clostridium] innocuum]|nr:hypothetical protein [[Clostridium] innocuum]
MLYRALLSLRRRIQHGASAVKQILQDQSIDVAAAAYAYCFETG